VHSHSEKDGQHQNTTTTDATTAYRKNARISQRKINTLSYIVVPKEQHH